MHLQGPILGVWAHPDDEAFLSAGLMVEALRNGQRVVCVTATRGELGIQDPERWPPDQLADIRTREMERCLRILGVTEHHWLDYPDAGCHEVDAAEAADRVCALIEDIRPANVLTFGPDGMTAHSDHIAISNWTTAAFKRCAPEGSRLLYATMTDGWWETYAEMLQLDKIVMTEDWEPPTIPDEEAAIAYRVPDDIFDMKKRALLAQESQIGAIMQALPEEHVWELNRTEWYRLGAQH